jgi:hypothetical protein
MNASIRVNYGNGQVDYVGSLAAARRLIAECRSRNDAWVGSYRIERYAGDGEWVRVRS